MQTAFWSGGFGACQVDVGEVHVELRISSSLDNEVHSDTLFIEKGIQEWNRLEGQVMSSVMDVSSLQCLGCI